jgi:hypothetical protein
LIELVFANSYNRYPSSGLVRYKDKLYKFFMFKLSDPTIYQVIDDNRNVIYAFTEKELDVGSRNYHYSI